MGTKGFGDFQCTGLKPSNWVAWTIWKPSMVLLQVLQDDLVNYVFISPFFLYINILLCVFLFLCLSLSTYKSSVSDIVMSTIFFMIFFSIWVIDTDLECLRSTTTATILQMRLFLIQVLWCCVMFPKIGLTKLFWIVSSLNKKQ